MKSIGHFLCTMWILLIAKFLQLDCWLSNIFLILYFIQIGSWIQRLNHTEDLSWQGFMHSCLNFFDLVVINPRCLDSSVCLTLQNLDILILISTYYLKKFYIRRHIPASTIWLPRFMVHIGKRHDKYFILNVYLVVFKIMGWFLFISFQETSLRFQSITVIIFVQLSHLWLTRSFFRLASVDFCHDHGSVS